MDTPSWQSLLGFGIFAGSWALGNNKPPSWDAVFPACGALIGVGLIAQNQIARTIDKMIERDAFRPSEPVHSQEIHEAKESRKTTGNTNVEVPLAENWQPIQHTTERPLKLKQTRQGWSLYGLGKRGKRELHPDMLAYQYTTDSAFPKADNEAMVADRLILMRNSNLSVDLREAYWVKGKHFPESADKFRAMLRKWQYHRMIERDGTNGNSSYVVVNWKKMRGVANGVTLPPPPNDFKA